MLLIRPYWYLDSRQPLREAVSWNSDLELQTLWQNTVSLFVRLWVEIMAYSVRSSLSIVSLFVRLWVEIILPHYSHWSDYRQPLREAVSWNKNVLSNPQHGCVSLFVRLWVEILHRLRQVQVRTSASSWGCELKCWMQQGYKDLLRSASSWGCELKYQ